MISNINAFYGIIDSWIMTTLGLELGSGNLGFNGSLVKSVLEGLTNFNAIDENTCLKRPRVSIRSLYLPEVHCSVFPVPLDSTSPQAQWHIGDSKNTIKRRCCSVECTYMATNDVSYSFFASTSTRIKAGLCVSNSEIVCRVQMQTLNCQKKNCS